MTVATPVVTPAWTEEQWRAQLDAARCAGDDTAQLHAAENLSHRLYLRGEHSAALKVALDAVPVASSRGHAVAEARARIAASSCLYEMGLLQHSAEQVYRSICLLERRDEPALLARAFNNAGRTAATLGQFADAVKFARASYRCARDHMPLAPLFIVNLADHHDSAGNHRWAYRMAAAALHDIRRRDLAPRWHAMALACMGGAALNQGRLDVAEEALCDALRRFRAGGDRRERCTVLVMFARLRLRQRRPYGVARLLRAVMRAATAIESYNTVEQARQLLAHWHAGDDPAAVLRVFQRPTEQVTPELALLLARVEIVIERGEARRLRLRALALAAQLRERRHPVAAVRPTVRALVAPSRRMDALTQREIDIARQVMTGATNKQIAQVLGLAAGTVRNHLSSVMSKLGVVSRGELIAALHRQLEPSAAPALPTLRNSLGKGT